MIETEEEIIFEPGEHLINLAFDFERSQQFFKFNDDDKRVADYYRKNYLNKSNNHYISSQFFITPEGYQVFQMNTDLTPDSRIIAIVTLINTQRVSISAGSDARMPGKPMDTMTRKLVNTNLDNWGKYDKNRRRNNFWARRTYYIF